MTPPPMLPPVLKRYSTSPVAASKREEIVVEVAGE